MRVGEHADTRGGHHETDDKLMHENLLRSRFS
jgi:hypothetical protein